MMHHKGNENPRRKGSPMPLTPFNFAARWRELSDEIMARIQEWCLQHPKATLREVEEAVDECLAELRAHMLQEVALTN
jgi:hypothetical protein